MSLEMAFWVCLGWLVYVYAGYPALVWCLAQLAGRQTRKESIEPRVTVVVAAFNEAGEIERTVVNKLQQDYLAERLEVIVVSDGSTDGTDAIVERLVRSAGGRLRLLRQNPRQGKTMALNRAVPEATGEIIVFADANSMYAPDTIRQLVRSFADPSVGYVTGQMVYTNPDGSGIGEGSGAYMRYENILRVWETDLHSVVGVNGGVDAVRQELYKSMRADQLPDFVLPLNVVEQGRRAVYEPAAKVYEAAVSAPDQEFRMRVRVSLRALWALFDKRGLLNPLRDPLFAWQLFSHKVLRYAAFVPLAGLLGVNMLLAGHHPFYAGFLALQLLAYGLAAAGPAISRLRSVAPRLLAPYYFILLNLACAAAFWKFLSGQKMVTWKPRGGS